MVLRHSLNLASACAVISCPSGAATLATEAEPAKSPLPSGKALHANKVDTTNCNIRIVHARIMRACKGDTELLAGAAKLGEWLTTTIASPRLSADAGAVRYAT